MKIVFVTEEDFETMWRKLVPQDRVQIGLACQHVYIVPRAILVIVKNTVSILDYQEDRSEKEFTLRDFFAWVGNQITVLG